MKNTLEIFSRGPRFQLSKAEGEISVIRLDLAFWKHSNRWFGFGKKSSCYKPGINRRNKLCRWVEVSRKIEFADSASPTSRRGANLGEKVEGNVGAR